MSLKLSKKSSMSFVDLLAWLSENKGKIVGCRVDNIYSILKGRGYLFLLHCRDGDKETILEPSRRIHFTRYQRERVLDNKAKMLRELVRGAVIREVDVVPGERIVVFSLSNDHKIYLELLPKGVLVVTDSQDRIKFVNEVREFKDREVRPGQVYRVPPKPGDLKPEETKKLLTKGALSRILGVPQEVLDALNLKASTQEELEEVKKKVGELFEAIRSGKIEPCIGKGTFMPLKFQDCTPGETFNGVVDDYFTEMERSEREQNESSSAEIGRLEATIRELEETVKKNREEAETLRKKGKTIMENFSQLEILRGKGVKEVTLGEVTVEIDPNLSLTRVASSYFERAKELESKARRAEETIAELKKKVEELKLKLRETEESKSLVIRKKEWYEKYRWSFTRNNYLVIAGRDVDQNESLVKKMLGEEEIFLHADIQGAPATIIKDSKGVQEGDIYDAAVVAACYSKAWKLGLGSVDVFWVYGSQVSKSPPSGEYLPKGSFMIYGKKNFIKNVRLELAIGLREEVRIEAGSEEAVKRRCNHYVVLTPGDNDVDKVAERVVKILTRGSELKGLKTLKEEIAKLIPGKSKILRTSLQLESKTGSEKQNNL
ncbi:putative RNA-binding protein, snRNP like protein [Metallosphaera yellowstonensis MK1]|jgi:predicted ribosome quality control (RQC) complex YloA/Tae2 family protein|uniref:Putative RNA-binding protein, snRNP like protein n=1 Tax=Metallosphaera yellowstonensis MK1 TaxID=671065 RepID=H2C6B6_9CREN|nr:putative RNA-binding protein, snRNP like protein [Metallosphaera yellowstonensis MK1]